MTGKDLPAQAATPTDTHDSADTGAEHLRLEAVAERAGRGDAASANQLTEMLADPRWRVRRAAADALTNCIHRAPALQAVLTAMRRGYRDLGLLNGVLRVLGQTNLDVLPALEEFLAAADPDLRIYAAQALGERGLPAAVPALLNRLGDSDHNVRSHAIEALGKLQSARATDALVEIALSGDFALAWPALDALAAIGDARIASRIVPLLEDDLLAEAAVQALGRLGDEEIVLPLLDNLASERTPAPMVASALFALHERFPGRHGEGEPVPALVKGVSQPKHLQTLIAACATCPPEHARALASVLGWFDGSEVIPGLLRLLAILEARSSAGEALVRKGELAAAALGTLLESEDAPLARTAIELIGRLGSSAHVPQLLSLLDQDAGSTPVVIGALARIGDARAYPALREQLVHPRANVRQAAVAAINCIAHPDRSADISQWLSGSSPLLRESALKIACYLGESQWVDAVIACCTDDNEQVRATAVENAAILDDERVPETLIRALRTGTPPVRAAATRTLQLSIPGVSTELLLAALDDRDVWVRYYAARALGSAKALDAPALEKLGACARSDDATQVRLACIQALIPYRWAARKSLYAELIHSPDGDLARAALTALGELHDNDSINMLIQTLDSDEMERRLAALEALGASGQQAAVGPLVRAVHEQNPDVARAAATALGQCECAEAAAALIELTALPRWRETCITVLTRMARQHCDWVVPGLEHPDLDVRRTVVQALSATRLRQASDAIRRAQFDISPAVRHAATMALAHATFPD
jgi:HEAT repeat protein